MHLPAASFDNSQFVLATHKKRCHVPHMGQRAYEAQRYRTPPTDVPIMQSLGSSYPVPALVVTLSSEDTV